MADRTSETDRPEQSDEKASMSETKRAAPVPRKASVPTLRRRAVNSEQSFHYFYLSAILYKEVFPYVCIYRNQTRTNMKNWRIEALILAIGLMVGGTFVQNGLRKLSTRNRVVTVKGLAEMEVKADKVTWPLVYKVLGNDMSVLYNEIKDSNRKITEFLKSKGIKDEEISINAPEIIDTKAERYNSSVQPYRYNVTTVITVTSKQVDLVRKLINEQSELLKQCT